MTTSEMNFEEMNWRNYCQGTEKFSVAEQQIRFRNQTYIVSFTYCFDKGDFISSPKAQSSNSHANHGSM